MQKKHWFRRSATLTLALVLLAGCGTEAAQPTPNSNPQTQGGAGGSGPTTVAATSVIVTPAQGTASVGSELALATFTPASGSVAGAGSGQWIDLKKLDVCGLLTEEEVRSLMPNVEFEQHRINYHEFPNASYGTIGESVCTLADTQMKGHLELLIYTPNIWDLDSGFLSIRLTGTEVETVAGLGDEAASKPRAHALTLNVLLRGRAALVIVVNPVYTSDGKYDAKQAKEIAILFAQKIIPRLR